MPYKVEVMIDEARFEKELKNPSELTEINVNITETSIGFKTYLPLLVTNHNYVYRITVDTEFDVHYPAHLKTSGLLLARSFGDVTVPPKFGGAGWQNHETGVMVEGKLEADDEIWSKIYTQVKEDCETCSMRPASSCTATTDMYIFGYLTPDEEAMPLINGLVGSIEVEAVEQLSCKDILGCTLLPLCPPLL